MLAISVHMHDTLPIIVCTQNAKNVIFIPAHTRDKRARKLITITDVYYTLVILSLSHSVAAPSSSISLGMNSFKVVYVLAIFLLTTVSQKLTIQFLHCYLVSSPSG